MEILASPIRRSLAGGIGWGVHVPQSPTAKRPARRLPCPTAPTGALWAVHRGAVRAHAAHACEFAAAGFSVGFSALSSLPGCHQPHSAAEIFCASKSICNHMSSTKEIGPTQTINQFFCFARNGLNKNTNPGPTVGEVTCRATAPPNQRPRPGLERAPAFWSETILPVQ